MRMSRWDWLARFFRPAAPRLRNKREKRNPKKPRTWVVMGKRFVGMTRSEARAQAKRALGFKGRLPVGIVVVEEQR